MVSIEFTEPVLMNGALITEGVLRQVLYLQTGNMWGNDKKSMFNNEGFNLMKEMIGDLTHALLEQLMADGLNTASGKKLLLNLETVYSIRSAFESFKVPDDKMG